MPDFQINVKRVPEWARENTNWPEGELSNVVDWTFLPRVNESMLFGESTRIVVRDVTYLSEGTPIVTCEALRVSERDLDALLLAGFEPLERRG